MKLALIQMNMILGEPETNFAHAEELIYRAAESGVDVIVLPETWNTGFYPEDLAEAADPCGHRVMEMMSRLAAQFHVNIVAGSAAVREPDGRIYNRAMVFDRSGALITSYDKVHLFTNMQEEQSFASGDRLCTFRLDGISCGLVICYDLRFVEWVRKTALEGIDLLFVPAQWPDRRLTHWQILNRARAIENQMFVACCNSCGTAGPVQYAGHSMIIDPLGDVLEEAGDREEILIREISFASLADLRESIPVFRDRRPELYE